jgi:hypothetical protein
MSGSVPERAQSGIEGEVRIAVRSPASVRNGWIAASPDLIRLQTVA